MKALVESRKIGEIAARTLGRIEQSLIPRKALVGGNRRLLPQAVDISHKTPVLRLFPTNLDDKSIR